MTRIASVSSHISWAISHRGTYDRPDLGLSGIPLYDELAIVSHHMQNGYLSEAQSERLCARWTTPRGFAKAERKRAKARAQARRWGKP